MKSKLMWVGVVAKEEQYFDLFRRIFNEQRPHEALGQQTPASVYGPSPREYRGRAARPVYAEGLPTRKVQSNGMIYWGSERIFIGEAFYGEEVAFVPQQDGVWAVQFAHVVLGLFDERKGVVRPVKGARSMSPG